MNFFALEKWPPAGNEHFETLYADNGVTIERIASNRLCKGEWYDQDHDEWVMLARGSATLEFGTEELRELQAGDWLLIGAHRRHRVLNTSEDALWLAVHFKNDA